MNIFSQQIKYLGLTLGKENKQLEDVNFSCFGKLLWAFHITLFSDIL